MKITAFILLAFCMQVSATTLAQNVTLSEHNAPLEKVIKDIKQQTGYSFFYNQDWLSQSQPVDIDIKDVPLDRALKLCFAGQPYDYAIVNNTIVLKLKKKPKEEPKIDVALPLTITGKVTDTLGTPLIGATVTITGSKKATITDDKGEFSVSANPGDELLISFIGYKPVKMTVAQNQPYITIALHSSFNGLKEVVVNNGFQTLPLERSTGSYAVVNNKLYNEKVSSSVIDRLEGNVPGMLFNHNTYNGNLGNAPTGGFDVNIRGHSTLFSNDQPLVVVDNFPYDGDITNLNPNDVENITVLKDAAAASIWGVRSGNGVIVITTKKGIRNQPLKVEFGADVTVGNKPNLYFGNEFLDSKDDIAIQQKLFDLGYYNSQISNPQTIVPPAVLIMANKKAGLISSTDAANQLNALGNVDVRKDLDKYFYQNSINQRYNVNFRGGSNNSDYYFSVGEDHGIANQVGNSNNRITINSSYNLYPVKNLKLSAVVNYTSTNGVSNFALPQNIYPYSQLADANGNALTIPRDFSAALKATYMSQGLLNWDYKPLDELHNKDNTTKGIDNLIKIGADYTIIKGLDIELNYQYQKTNYLSQQDNNINLYDTRSTINAYTQIGSDGTLTYPVPLGGILYDANSQLNSQQFRGQLNFNRNWGKNQLSLLLGAEVHHTESEGNSTQYYGYDKNTGTSISAIDYVDYFNLNPSGGSGQIGNAGGISAAATSNFIGYFSNLGYTYDNLYTLTASARIDHSNLFGVSTNQKAVPLYSLGFAWDLSHEKFYQIDWLPVLKPRFTFGYTANINTGAAAVTTIYYQTGQPYFPINNPYAFISNIGNRDLRWEKTQESNIGIDYGIKNNIISGSLEYYWKKGIDLFGTSPLDPTTGIASYFGNTSNTAGKGTDITINSINVNTKRFKWTSSFIFSHVLDKVTKYNVPTTVASYFGSNTLTPVVGAPVFALYSFKWAGLSHSTGEPQGILNGKPSTDYASIVNTATMDSLQYNGTARPTTFGSLRNTFSFGNLSVSINILYEFNYYFRKASVDNALEVQGNNGIANGAFLKAWQKPGDELNTDVPSIDYSLTPDANKTYFYTYSSGLVDKGDNIRLQNINLSYDLNKNNWKKNPFSHIQVYADLSNLGILWRANKDHLDPDLPDGGTSWPNAPAPKTFAIGLKANF